MNYRHKPYRESRTLPVNPAEMQKLVTEINLKAIRDDYDPSDDRHLEQS